MPHHHNIIDDDNRFIIDTETREISNVSGSRIKLMQYDHKSERFGFEIPRTVEGHDVLECDLIEIQFQNIGSGTSASLRPVLADKYTVTDAAIDPENDDLVIFTWLLERTATQYAGTLSFQIKLACYDTLPDSTYSFVWHTSAYKNISVESGLDIEGSLDSAYPSVLDRLDARLTEMEKVFVEYPPASYLMMNEDNRVIKLGEDLSPVSRTITTHTYTPVGSPVQILNNVYKIDTEVGLKGRWVLVCDTLAYVYHCAYIDNSDEYQSMWLYLRTGEDEDNAESLPFDIPAGTVIYPVDVDVTELIQSTDVTERVVELENKVADLLYEPISITSFSNNVGTVETGSVVTSVKLSWGFNKPPVEVTLNDQTQNNELREIELTGLSISSNTNWRLQATDERDKTAAAITGITFLNAVYYGVGTNASVYNSDFVTFLGNSGSKNLRSSKLPKFAVDAAAGTYIYYCQPSSYGTCEFAVGGFDGGFDLIATIDYTNIKGHTQEYYIYRSTNAGLGKTTVEVK